MTLTEISKSFATSTSNIRENPSLVSSSFKRQIKPKTRRFPYPAICFSPSNLIVPPQTRFKIARSAPLSSFPISFCFYSSAGRKKERENDSLILPNFLQFPEGNSEISRSRKAWRAPTRASFYISSTLDCVPRRTYVGRRVSSWRSSFRNLCLSPVESNFDSRPPPWFVVHLFTFFQSFAFCNVVVSGNDGRFAIFILFIADGFNWLNLSFFSFRWFNLSNIVCLV